MSNRPPRSSSIPVRGTIPSSPARNIESVISIPFSTNPAQSRPRITTQGWPQRNPHDHRAIGIPYGVRGSSTMASTHPTRPTARSFTQSSVLSGRGTAYPHTTYEPRVIRADSARGPDVACPQSSSTSSVSPARARQLSATGVRAPSAQRSSVALIPVATEEPVPCPRPAYLDHSAFRHLLQTESPSLLPPRKTEPTVVRVGLISGRRSQRSPSYDSDEEDMTPPPEVQKSTPPTTSSTTLLLPTRWCDEYRSAHLTLSGDDRELSYQGKLICSSYNLN
jgi:hypothetical protein